MKLEYSNFKMVFGFLSNDQKQSSDFFPQNTQELDGKFALFVREVNKQYTEFKTLRNKINDILADGIDLRNNKNYLKHFNSSNISWRDNKEKSISVIEFYKILDENNDKRFEQIKTYYIKFIFDHLDIFDKLFITLINTITKYNYFNLISLFENKEKCYRTFPFEEKDSIYIPVDYRYSLFLYNNGRDDFIYPANMINIRKIRGKYTIFAKAFYKDPSVFNNSIFRITKKCVQENSRSVAREKLYEVKYEL